MAVAADAGGVRSGAGGKEDRESESPAGDGSYGSFCLRVRDLTWVVYILECADGTFYTGVTRDVDARLARHVAGNGARYTRGRWPFKVVYTEMTSAKGAALRRERQIKGMRKGKKLALIEAGRGGS